jgi:Tectonin domain
MSRTNLRFVVWLTVICLAAAVVPASAQHFEQIAGTPLSQIAAGRAEVWGLYNSRIYRFNPSTKNFAQISGSLEQIAVGGGTLLQPDEVWGVNSGHVYRFDFSTNSFAWVPGVKQCWFCLPIFFSKIAVGGGGRDHCHPYEMWGISYFPGVNVYRYNYCTSFFDKISSNVGAVSGNFTQIAVGPTGDVWGLWQGVVYPEQPATSIVFEYMPSSSDGTWGNSNIAASNNFPFTWQQITVGTNQAWAVDSFGAIWFWAPPLEFPVSDINSTEVTFSGAACGISGDGCPSGLVTKIASGGDGVWFIYTGSDGGQAGLIGRFDPWDGSSSVPLPAGANPAAVQIAVGSGAGVWVIDASDEVFTFVRP